MFVHFFKNCIKMICHSYNCFNICNSLLLIWCLFSSLYVSYFIKGTKRPPEECCLRSDLINSNYAEFGSVLTELDLAWEGLLFQAESISTHFYPFLILQIRLKYCLHTKAKLSMFL